MLEYFLPSENNDTAELLRRYERSLRESRSVYFDAEEIESIADHYIMKENLPACRRVVALGERLHPSNTLIVFLKVKLLYAEGNFDLALQTVRELERMEADSEYFIWEGMILLKQGWIDDAKKVFWRAVDEERGQKGMVCADIAAYLIHESPLLDDAVPFMERAHELNPDDLSMLSDLALLYHRLARYEDAVAVTEKNLDIDPYQEYEWYRMGELLGNLHRYEEAVRAFDFALSIDENFVEAYLSKGQMLFDMGSYIKAAEVYEMLADMPDLQGDRAGVLLFIAECYERVEDYAVAEGYYRRAYMLDDKNADACTGIAVCLLELGDYGESLKYLYRATEINPSDFDTWIYIADCCANMDMLDDAIEAYRRSLFFNWKQPEVLMSMGGLLVDLGEVPEALAHLQEAEQMDANMKGLASLLTVAYSQMGDFKTASYYMRKAMAIEKEKMQELMDIFSSDIDWEKMLEG